MLATERRLCKAPIRNMLSGEMSPDEGAHAEATTDAMLRLQRNKERVPAAKKKVGEANWKRAVDRIQCVRVFPRPDDNKIISRAYSKMYEMLLSCALRPPSASLHVCEAPGGFVQATHKFVQEEAKRATKSRDAPHWRWVATSLPSAILFDETRLPHYCGKIVYSSIYSEGGLDVNGFFISEPVAGFDLFTADGAADVVHSDLESDHLPLLVAETHAMLGHLKEGGDAIFKFFEGKRFSPFFFNN